MECIVFLLVCIATYSAMTLGKQCAHIRKPHIFVISLCTCVAIPFGTPMLLDVIPFIQLLLLLGMCVWELVCIGIGSERA